MSRIYGLSKSKAMQLASKIKKQNTNFQEAIVYQPTIFHEWQITPAGGNVTLSRLNQKGFNTIRIPLFSPKQTTVKKLGQYIYQMAVELHYDSEAYSAVFHSTFEFEMSPSNNEKYPDLTKVWHMKPNDPSFSRYLFSSTIPRLATKLGDLKKRIGYKYPDAEVFDIDFLIDNNNIHLISAPRDEEKYFSQGTMDVSNYCMMYLAH